MLLKAVGGIIVATLSNYCSAGRDGTKKLGFMSGGCVMMGRYIMPSRVSGQRVAFDTAMVGNSNYVDNDAVII